MKYLIFSLFILFTLNVRANAMGPELIPGQVLTADFTQYRHLKGIPKPLESKGSMVLWVGKGLIWTTSEPFPNELLITKSGMYQIEKNSKKSVTKGGSDNAIFDAMAGIFSFSQSKDIPGFNKEEGVALKDKWLVNLQPNQSQVQNFIQTISIEGNEHISYVRIFRPNGDYDEIQLINHKVTDSMSPKLRAHFND